MDKIAIGIVTLEGLIFVALGVAIVVLIVRRIRIKKKETFEKRDN